MARAIQKGGGIRRNNTTIAHLPNGTIRVKLYDTVIAELVRFKGQTCAVLNTCGFATSTTFRRMNECLCHWGFQKRVCKADFANSRTMCVEKNNKLTTGTRAAEGPSITP